MMRRSMLMFAAALVLLPACHKKQPEVVTPQPVQQPPAPRVNEDSLRREQMRQDSIRRANEMSQAAREASERARATVEQTVYFDYDSFEIRSDAKEALDAKLPILRANPDLRVRIEGNADERGSVEYNLALGMRRAVGAKDYLVGFGLDGGRFETISYGEERPVDMGHDDNAFARNRRDDFKITNGGSSLRPGQ
jgi:peptidoglycan-associated lipoprotein